jgi:ABC-type dipeptide/oligopeptide/nickel transport system permease subunit
LILVAMLGPSMTNIIIAIALTSIPPFARIARAPTIAIKEREFVMAAARSVTPTHASSPVTFCRISFRKSW